MTMTRKGKSHEIPIETDETPIEADATPDISPESAKATRDEDSAEGNAEVPEEDATYEQALDHLRRLQAEFTNYKRRVGRERLETVGWAQRSLVEKLLPVLDDFDRAVSSLDGEDSPAAQGMILIRDKLTRTLIEAGMEKMETQGVAFDPEIHEALMTVPVEAAKVGMVISELVPGFTYKGQLVRPARVQVGIETEEE